MSILIDSLVYQDRNTIINTNINGKWYVAKSIDYVCLRLIWRRIKDSCRVLAGKSFAVHYKIDEKGK
jgi:hypothetical protein